MVELLQRARAVFHFFFRTLDLPLLGALCLLMVAGLAVLHSVDGPVHAQAMRYGAGLAALWGLSRLPVVELRAWSPWIYTLSLLPLLAVYVVGTGKYGQRWLNLGVFYLQPSELLKLSLLMMMAWYLHKQPLPPRPRAVLTAAVLIGGPAVLILLQPNLGTATLVTASGVFALLLAGLRWWWMAVALGGLSVAAPLAWFGLLRQYQKDRVLTFLYPENDPLGTGWNIIQSKIAIGSGGLHGQGRGQGTQATLDFLPEYTFPARVHHRLRLLGAGRGVRLGRRGSGAQPVPVRYRALPVDRQPIALWLLAPVGGHHRPGVLRLCAGQRRHDLRPAAGGGRADAADQLRRHLGGLAAGQFRAGHGRTTAPAGACHMGEVCAAVARAPMGKRFQVHTLSTRAGKSEKWRTDMK